MEGISSIVFHADCMEVMRRYPDQYFDLAVVDPIYGDVKQGGYCKGQGGGVARQNNYDNTVWHQEKTGVEYFTELFRVSKNQIIWGGNYFAKEINRNSPCWIVWDKCRPEGVSFADCELAWTSFSGAARIFRYMWNGFCQGKGIDNGHLMRGNKKLNEARIHPMQKPTDLYRWIYREFNVLPGSKILDTHLGSGTNRIAAYDYGLDFVGCEVVDRYWIDQEKVFAEYTSQMRIAGV